MHLRTETADDYQEVFDLNYRAFGNREDESRLIERIRESEDFIPELSIVAEEDETVIGHILLSGAKVTDGTAAHNVIALAPIAVHPDYQGKGVGRQLIGGAQPLQGAGVWACAADRPSLLLSQIRLYTSTCIWAGAEAI